MTICQTLWALRGSGAFFSDDKKNSSFISFGSCSDLFLYTAVWKEKLDFKEKHTESNSLIESFYAIQTKCLCCANEWKKNFSLT